MVTECRALVRYNEIGETSIYRAKYYIYIIVSLDRFTKFLILCELWVLDMNTEQFMLEVHGNKIVTMVFMKYVHTKY